MRKISIELEREREILRQLASDQLRKGRSDPLPDDVLSQSRKVDALLEVEMDKIVKAEQERIVDK